MRKADILIHNSSKLITLSGHASPLTGHQMKDLSIIEDGAVAVSNGIIIETGTSKGLLDKYKNAEKIINADKKLVMPGFVDCHTHLVFAGTREYELGMKLSGASYIDILKKGGGIYSTVKATRKASHDDLLTSARQKLNNMISHGTTTVELKSGYGLDHETEEKLLLTAEKLKHSSDAEIVSTFLGAHVIPKDISREDYISWIIKRALPSFAHLAEFCDIFTEEGAYSYEETNRILSEAIKYNYKLKIHAGQFNDLKAAGLAAKLGAISADHLEKISQDQLDILKEEKTICVLMPGVNFFLMSEDYADARQMIDNGNSVALATDFNPGSCPCYSMQMIIALACYKLKMLPEEALAATTLNAAFAINREKISGSLDIGKRADILILNVSEPSHIPYFFGSNLVDKIILKGKLFTA